MAIVDKKTPRLGLLLPNADNFLQDDVERLIQSFDLLDVLVVMRDQTTGKIADDQLSEVIARLDAQGKIATSALPSSVVQKGADGKIDASVLPSIAIIDSFPVPNEASMLGLQCERGDIAIRTDLGRSFILTDLPPSKLSNWRELTSTNVTSVNGQVGAITGLAKAGVNDDITQLTALSGPLRLGGEAAGDYDAVTLKQLRAASGGAGGASMNGVMNNFIGAVEWFNGTRAKLPAGYIAADGAPISKVDYPDLWAAVKSGLLNSVTEALWQNNGTQNPYGNRGKYSVGSQGVADDAGLFRCPDLNGVQSGGLPHLFLSSLGIGSAESSGFVAPASAPRIIGSVSNVINHGTPVTSNSMTYGGEGDPGLVASPNPGAQFRFRNVNFDAAKSSPAYSRTDNEINPNAAYGIWIIRASGTFTAQNTNFNVINGDATKPANNTAVFGGSLVSAYQVGGVNYASAELRVKSVIGNKPNAEVLLTDNSSGTPSSVALRLGPSKGFIEGLDLSILSSGVTVYPGAAVLGTGELVEVTSAITKELPAYVNSTFFSVYLFNNNGTPDIDISTTAPVKYYGNASAKGSDLSRRFLGYYRISSGGLLAECNCINGIARFVASDNQLLRLVAGTAPTTYTQVIMSGFIMTGIARSIMFDGTNSAAANGPVVEYSGVNGKTYSTFQSGMNKYEAEVFFNDPNSPKLWYKFSSAPSSGGFFLDIKGFRFDR